METGDIRALDEDEADSNEIVCGLEEETGDDTEVELDAGVELDCVKLNSGELASVEPEPVTDGDLDREIDDIEVDANGDASELVDEDWPTTLELSSSEDDEAGRAV
jgi:hypothetical protein